MPRNLLLFTILSLFFSTLFIVFPFFWARLLTIIAFISVYVLWGWFQYRRDSQKQISVFLEYLGLGLLVLAMLGIFLYHKYQE